MKSGFLNYHIHIPGRLFRSILFALHIRKLVEWRSGDRPNALMFCRKFLQFRRDSSSVSNDENRGVPVERRKEGFFDNTGGGDGRFPSHLPPQETAIPKMPARITICAAPRVLPVVLLSCQIAKANDFPDRKRLSLLAR